MTDRNKAEQIFVNHLFKQNKIKADDDVSVRRFSHRENFSVIKGTKVIGYCDFNPRINRYVDFQPIKVKKQKIKQDKTFNISHFLKKEGIKVRKNGSL